MAVVPGGLTWEDEPPRPAARPGATLRIAVLATNRNPLAEPYAGGQESLTAALARGFRERGHHVRLYAAAGTDPALADELVTYPELPPLSVVARCDPQLPERDFLRDHHAFTAAVADLGRRDDVDVVANHSLHHLPLSLSTTLAAPVVTTLHTPPFPWLELGAALAAPTARYVAVSRAVQAQWTTLTSTVIPNGVDPAAWPLGPGSPSGDLVWVGRLTPEKAPHLAVEVARRLGRRLTVVGPVSDRPYVESRAADLTAAHVTLTGPLQGAALAEAVGAASALLVTPAWDEPFGLVAVEGALCGTPVVALGRGGLPEAVAPGCGVVVPDHGGRSEQDRVSALVAAVPRAEALHRGGVRAAAVAAHGLEACVDGHLRVLASAAAGVPTR